MRRLSVAPWLLAALAVLAFAAPAAAQGGRPAVALLDFDYASLNSWWGNQDIGKGIADLVVDGLVEDGSYRVIERKRLDAILAEQNFSNSDRANPSAAKTAQIGKALGVKYLIVGSITKFGMEQQEHQHQRRRMGLRRLRRRRRGDQEGQGDGRRHRPHD